MTARFSFCPAVVVGRKGLKMKLKGMLAALVALTASLASAETIMVTNALDVGEGTLRCALGRANDGDRIRIDLPGGTFLHLTSTIRVDGNRFPSGIAVNGNGCTVDGGGNHRILEVLRGNRIRFSDMTFARGRSEQGGAISNLGDLEFRNCTFGNNVANGQGGAVWNAGDASFHAINCAFDGNQAKGQGGAVYSNLSKLLLERCSFVRNASGVQGGALYGSQGTVTLVGCAISENCAEENGGAVFTRGGLIANCTIIENKAECDGGITAFDTTIVNSIITGNEPSDYRSYSGGVVRHSALGQCKGGMEFPDSKTGVLLQDALCPSQTIDVNGVAQRYYPLMEGGVAENAGVIVWHDKDWTSVAYGLAEDGQKTYLRGSAGAERRLSRDQLGRRFHQPSIGSLSIPMFQVTSCADSGLGSLREALDAAEDGDTILFDLRLGRNVIELKTSLVIECNRFKDRGITIGGANGGRSVTVKGDGMFQLLTVKAGNKVNVDGVTFRDGKGDCGGAIGNSGSLTVRNCGFVGNVSPSWGGAICNWRGASCYAQNCDFTGNRCGGWGGAVASHTAPLTTLLNCRFADNACEAWGGALAAYGSGDMLVVNCEIRGNHAYGGAVVAQSNARLTLIGSTLTDNVADFAGADVFNLGGTVNAIGSLCRDNHGQVTGTTDLQPLPVKRSSLVSTDTKALGNWYSKAVDANGYSCLRLNDHACPRFAPRMKGRPLFEVTAEDWVSMPVENVKPYLYYGLGWSDTPDGDYHVEPGRWIQADANGNLPGEVKAPRGKGNSRFFRVKVTDDPQNVN